MKLSKSRPSRRYGFLSQPHSRQSGTARCSTEMLSDYSPSVDPLRVISCDSGTNGHFLPICYVKSCGSPSLEKNFKSYSISSPTPGPNTDYPTTSRYRKKGGKDCDLPSSEAVFLTSGNLSRDLYEHVSFNGRKYTSGPIIFNYHTLR